MHKERSSVPNFQLSLITAPGDLMPSSRLLRHLYIQHAHLKMRYLKRILNKKKVELTAEPSLKRGPGCKGSMRRPLPQVPVPLLTAFNLTRQKETQAGCEEPSKNVLDLPHKLGENKVKTEEEDEEEENRLKAPLVIRGEEQAGCQ